MVINYGVVKSEQNFLFCEMFGAGLCSCLGEKMAIWSFFCVFSLLSTFLPQKMSDWRLFSALLLWDELQVVDSSHLPMAVAPPLPEGGRNFIFLVEKSKSEQPLLVAVNIHVTSVMANNCPRCGKGDKYLKSREIKSQIVLS